MPSLLSIRSILFLVLAVLCLSTAVLLIQLSRVPPLGLTAWRLLLAALVLLPLAWREWSHHRLRSRRRIALGLAVLPGLVFAVHLVSWVSGARQTPTANASLIANMTPVVLPGLLYVIAGERVSRREWVGTGMAMVGLLILVSGDFHLSPETALGDLICLGSMLFLALYLALARQRSPRVPGFALYIAPLCLTGAGACFLLMGLTGEPLFPEASQWKWVIALALVPTVMGHGLLNYSMKSFRGQVVAVASQTQFIFAGTAAFFIFGTLPALTFYPACVLAIAGAVIVMRRQPRESASP